MSYKNCTDAYMLHESILAIINSSIKYCVYFSKYYTRYPTCMATRSSGKFGKECMAPHI